MVNSEYEALIEMINQYDVISFDVFDTLLLRNVLQPSVIFKILSDEVHRDYNIDNFYQIRIDAEAKSRTEENNGETSLDLIYENIDLKDATILEKIKEREIELEKEFLIANPFMKKIYDYCIFEEKVVICITDMYLPKQVIVEVLEKNGYTPEEIFLSCDYMKQKRDGKLYQLVFDEKHYDKKKWLHIGDNLESDVNQARNFGISAYHYIKILNRSGIERIDDFSIAESILNGICINYILNGLYEKKGLESFFALSKRMAKFIILILRNATSCIYFLGSDTSVVQNVIEKAIKKADLPLKIFQVHSCSEIQGKNAIIVGIKFDPLEWKDVDDCNSGYFWVGEKNNECNVTIFNSDNLLTDWSSPLYAQILEECIAQFAYLKDIVIECEDIEKKTKNKRPFFHRLLHK